MEIEGGPFGEKELSPKTNDSTGKTSSSSPRTNDSMRKSSSKTNDSNRQKPNQTKEEEPMEEDDRMDKRSLYFKIANHQDQAEQLMAQEIRMRKIKLQIHQAAAATVPTQAYQQNYMPHAGMMNPYPMNPVYIPQPFYPGMPFFPPGGY